MTFMTKYKEMIVNGHLFISKMIGKIIGFLPVILLINGYSVSVISVFRLAKVVLGS